MSQDWELDMEVSSLRGQLARVTKIADEAAPLIKDLTDGLRKAETRADKAEQQRDRLTFSINTCVGAAGIGDADELCGWIDNVKQQLAQAQAHWLAADKELIEISKLVGCEVLSSPIYNSVLKLKEERDQSQAQAAEMRDALEAVKGELSTSHSEQFLYELGIIDHALSTSCGSGMIHVAELDKTIELLRDGVENVPSIKAEINRLLKLKSKASK